MALLTTRNKQTILGWIALPVLIVLPWTVMINAIAEGKSAVAGVFAIFVVLELGAVAFIVFAVVAKFKKKKTAPPRSAVEEALDAKLKEANARFQNRARRLAALEEARAQGIVTEEEYRAKRQEIVQRL